MKDPNDPCPCMDTNANAMGHDETQYPNDCPRPKSQCPRGMLIGVALEAIGEARTPKAQEEAQDEGKPNEAIPEEAKPLAPPVEEAKPPAPPVDAPQLRHVQPLAQAGQGETYTKPTEAAPTRERTVLQYPADEPLFKLSEFAPGLAEEEPSGGKREATLFYLAKAHLLLVQMAIKVHSPKDEDNGEA